MKKKISLKSGLTLPELALVAGVLLLIGALSLLNFQQAKVRARDAQRKADVKAVAEALKKYFNDFDELPPSEGEKIVACGSADSISACRWGLDEFRDLNEPDFPPYLEVIPKDPLSDEGYSYVYLKRGKQFLVLASLESQADPEYDPAIAEKGIKCGELICNFGVSSDIAKFFEEEE